MQAFDELIFNILEILDVMLSLVICHEYHYEKDCHKKRSEMLTWKSRHIVKRPWDVEPDWFTNEKIVHSLFL